MTDLDKITKDVSPTSLKEPKKTDPKSIELICEDIISQFKFNVEDTNNFNEGLGLEKLNRTFLLKMLFEIIVKFLVISLCRHVKRFVNDSTLTKK